MSPRQPGPAPAAPDRLERLLRGDDPAVRDRPPQPWDEAGDPFDGVPDDEGRPGRHRPVTVPVLSVPDSLRSADLRVGPRAVRGVLVLAVVAVLVLGGRWLWSQRATSEASGDRVVVSEHVGSTAGPGAPEPRGVGGAETAHGPGQSAVPATPAPTAEAGRLLVHVTGQVAAPGVVELAVGDRVVDAVRAAGGFTADADQSRLNLARPLLDGEQVWVGRPGEEPPLLVPLAGAPSGSPGQTASSGEAVAAAPLLDLNAADQAQLEELPGIGPVTAGRILAWRDEHGRFSSVEELMEVSGIGERTFAQLEPVVSVGG